MRILLIGKTGVFDTLAVAYGYLGMDLGSCSYLGDLGLEKRKGLIKVGTDPNGAELYIVGFNGPQIINTINREIQSISNIKDEEGLLVFPLSIEGETFSWLLTKLANIPLVGRIFHQWATNRTWRRSSYLLKLGRELPITNHPDKAAPSLVYAAKPQPK